jgi:hypothetical protein
MYSILTALHGNNMNFMVSTTRDLEEETNLRMMCSKFFHFIGATREATIDEKYLVVELRVT